MKQNKHVTQQILKHNYTALKECKCDRYSQYYYFVQNGGVLSEESFYTLYLNYYILLEKFFELKLPLKKYEKQIKGAIFLRMLPVNQSASSHCYLPTWKLEYFELNVYPIMYLLNEQDIHTLLSVNLQMLNNPDDSLLELIDRTYYSVLDLGGQKSVVHCVDHCNHDLVGQINIRISYDEFRTSILGSNRLWFMRNSAQYSFLHTLMKEMEREFSEILGTDIHVYLGTQ